MKIPAWSLAITALLLGISDRPRSGGRWFAIGPGGGRVASLFTTTGGPVALSGGVVFRSDALPAAWSSRPLGSGPSAAWSALTASRDGTRLYVSDGPFVRASTDGGASFGPRSLVGVDDQGFPLPVSGLSLRSSDPGEVLAETSTGPWRSTDAGRTWSPPGPGTERLQSIQRDGQRDEVAYALNPLGRVFASTDAGISWSQTTSPAGLLSTTPAGRAGFLFALQNDGDVFASEDFGATWERRGVLEGGTILRFDPAAAGSLYGGRFTGEIAHSSDGGRSWRDLHRGRFLDPVTAIGATADGKVLAASTLDGVVGSTDAGASWLPMSDGVSGQMVRSILDGNVASTSGGIYREVGGRWVLSMDGIEPAPYGYSLTLAPGPSGWIYASGPGHAFYRSTDKGVSWTALSDRGVDLLVSVPGSEGALYGARGGSLVKSLDGGRTWSEPSLEPLPRPSALAVSPTGVVFLGTQSAIRTSSDGGRTWRIGTGVGSVLEILAFAFDPRGESRVYAGSARGGVLHSSDGGLTWGHDASGLPMSGSGESSVNALAVDPSEPDRVFAGSSVGPYVSQRGASFSTFGSGFWANSIHALSVDSRRPGSVWAGTDNGLFYFAPDGDVVGVAGSGTARRR